MNGNQDEPRPSVSASAEDARQLRTTGRKVMGQALHHRAVGCGVLITLLLSGMVINIDVIHAFDVPADAGFPASTREALVAKSKQINPSVPITPTGYSNRAGTVVTPVAIASSKKGRGKRSTSTVYTMDRPFLWNDIDVSCRATVIELSSGSNNKPDLWVHAPVGLDGPLKQAMDKIGNVKHVVSPNYEHVKYAPEWYLSYPEAKYWGCPGLAEKLASVQWDGEIPQGYRPLSWVNGGQQEGQAPTGIWDLAEIEALHVDCEAIPVTGKPFFNEVVFFHAPTKTCLMTDLFWNYPAGNGVTNAQLPSTYGVERNSDNESWELAPTVDTIPFGSQFWKFAMDNVYPPLYKTLLLRDPAKYKEIAKHIVNVWQPEVLIPAHGDILRGRTTIQSVLKRHFKL